MTKDELTNFLHNQIEFIGDDLRELGDRDSLIENAAYGGNHDDSFGYGEDYGYYNGRLDALKAVLQILEETPAVEHQSN